MDGTGLHGPLHCTFGLTGVGAVAVSTTCGTFEYLGEIVTDLLMLHIECAEPFYSRSVYYPAALGQREHLGESGGVHTGIMLFGYLRCALVQLRQDGVHQGALPHSGIAGNK